MSALATLRAAGLTASLNGDRLHVEPATKLTDDLRTFIREHKPAIMAELSEPVRDRARNIGKGPPRELTKPTKPGFVSFGSTQDGHSVHPRADDAGAGVAVVTYTRCLDCTHYSAPPPDTAFWCSLVKGHPMVALWAICTGYQAKAGTPPGPTTPPEETP